MLIFLDLDGVLRRRTAPLYKLEPALVQTFEDTVRGLPGAQIVITSSWREAFSLREIRGHFSPDIASRIVGVTPVSQTQEGFPRHREVLAYLKRRTTTAEKWIAIDDDPLHYPKDRRVLLVDPDCGFNSEAARLLVLEAGRQGPGP